MTRLQPRVDGFAFEGENAEDAFVDAVERLERDEAFKCFDAQAELADREGPFVAEAALAEPIDLGG